MNLYILDLYYLKAYWAKPKAPARERRGLNDEAILSLEEVQNLRLEMPPFPGEQEDLTIFRTVEI